MVPLGMTGLLRAVGGVAVGIAVVAVAGVAVVGAMSGCDRKAPGAKAAAPLIKLPAVFAAADGFEWMRLSSPESFFRDEASKPLGERMKEHGLVAEPIGSEWYLLVRNDPAGRCEPKADAKPGAVSTGSTPEGDAVIQFAVAAASRTAVSDMTGRNLGRPVALTIDGLVYSAPSVQSKLASAVTVPLPAADRERAASLADRLGRGGSALSLRAVVLAGERPEEADLRGKFQRLASGETVKK